MKTVMCAGCFDILHYGHLLHLRAAREYGDRLVVALTADRYIHKGPGRPVFPEDQRAEMLRALVGTVDEVVIYHARTPAEVILRFRPAVYCKGVDYFGQTIPEQDLIEELGGRVVFTTTRKWSSTALVEVLQ
jgi:rfaE bifunctional protein nucleotidyltransferase chain/domain